MQEETLSTLDYAHRAKNIKNKPEARGAGLALVQLQQRGRHAHRMSNPALQRPSLFSTQHTDVPPTPKTTLSPPHQTHM